LKIMGNLIHNKTPDTFKFLFLHFLDLKKLVRHCYSRSMTSILILILNVRKTLRVSEPGEPTTAKFEEIMTLKRQETLSHVAKLCIETCDDPEFLETHLNSYMILVDAMENMESIQNGKVVIDWVLFGEESKVFEQIVALFLDTSRRSYGQIPELLNHVCATVKKIHGHTESNSEYDIDIIPLLVPIVTAIGSDLERVVSLDPKKACTQSSTYGGGSPLLGKRRLQSIELLNILMDLKETKIDEALGQSTVAQDLIKMYYHFPWHNILHNVLTSLIKHVLNFGDYPMFEAEVDNPLTQFLKDRTRLIVPLIEASKDSKMTIKSGEVTRVCSLGFRSHFIELTQALLQSTKPQVIKLIAKEGGIAAVK
jgi:hypothetical protein